MTDKIKPRLREIIEGALGNVIGAVLLAVIGFTAGGVTIGWFPTFVIFIIVIGVFVLWYRFDPNLRSLIRQRIFKIKHAVSSQSVVMSRWNLITEETILLVARQNNLIRGHLQVEQSRIIKFLGQDHLELVLDYNNKKWLVLASNNGTVVDLYGGFRALSGKCERCDSSILVKYGAGKNGKFAAESLTTCRRCKHRMTLSVVEFGQKSDFNVKVKSINKHDIETRDGNVWVHIEFTIQNFSQTVMVRPHLELKIATLKNGGLIEQIARQDLSPIEIQSYSERIKTLDWKFPPSTLILTQKNGWLAINLFPC